MANAWTSQRSGHWSIPSNDVTSPWHDGGVQTARSGIPADTDTGTVAAGHTIQFNTDTSGFATGLGAWSVASTGVLQASEVYGTYSSHDSGTDIITVNETHEWITNQRVIYRTTGTAFGGLTANTIYYVIPVAAKTLQLSLTSGGAAIDLSADAGTGSHYFEPIYEWKAAGILSILGGGSLLAGSVGTAYNSHCNFRIYINGNYYVTCNAGGIIALYCSEPANTYCKLSGAGGIGDTVLSVDTDLTGVLYWKDVSSSAGVLVDINNINKTNDSERRTCTAVSSGPNTITISAGLTATKAIGAYVVLVHRNIVVYGTTYGGTGSQYGFYNTSSGNYTTYIRACIRDLARALASTYNITHAGVVSGCTYGAVTCFNLISSAIFSAAAMSSVYGCSFSGLIIGINTAFNSTYQTLLSGTMTGCYIGFDLCADLVVSGTITKISIGLNRCGNVTLSGATLTGNDYDMTRVTGRAYNTLMASPVEIFAYSIPTMGKNSLFQSYDHDQSPNTFKSWSPGGITTSDTVLTRPSGFALSYKIVPETLLIPGFFQSEKSIQPGETCYFGAYLQKDFDEATEANRPKIEILNASQDPLVNSSWTPLATETMTDVKNAWEWHRITYKNTTSLPIPLILRCSVMRASGNAYFCTNWDVPKESW